MKDLSSPIECVKLDHMILNRDFLDTLKDLDLDSFEKVWQFRDGETVKEIKARSVIRMEVSHRGEHRYFYLKRHKREFRGLQKLLALFLPNKAVSQGQIEFKQICDFRRSGLATVSPVAAGERYHRFFWVESFLITEDFYPFSSLEDLLTKEPDLFSGPKAMVRRQVLIKEISFYARRMHKIGFNHRDYNATHILIYYENGTDTPSMAVFDLQRVDQRKLFRFRWMIKTLARVNFTLLDSPFSKAERIRLLLDYKGKDKLSVFDRILWFYVKRKTFRIQRACLKREKIENVF